MNRKEKTLKIGRSYNGISLDFDTDNLHEVEIPTKDGYGEVMFLGDLHIGHNNFSRNHLERYIAVLKANPHIRIILMGDYFEAGEFGSEYMIEDQTKRLGKQIEEFLSIFKPVANQIIAMLYGNHEERLIRDRRTHDIIKAVCGEDKDILMIIAERLGNTKIITGKPQLGLVLCLKVNGQTYPVFVHHSSTGAITNQMTQVKRTSFNWALPLLAHGHVHRKGWQDHTYFTVTEINGKLYRQVVRQYWMLTGCFLREPAYAEAKSYPIPDIGAPIVRFYSDIDEMDYIDTRTQKEYRKFFRKAGGTIYRVPIDMSWWKKSIEKQTCENIPPMNNKESENKKIENLPPEEEYK